MAINKKITTTAVLVAASFAFGSAANADVCNTPSKLGDMGSFPGEVITVQGSLLGTDQEMFLNTVSCFEKATWKQCKMFDEFSPFFAFAVTHNDL